MIKVLLVDDHSIIRQGLKTMLENSSAIHIIGEAENGIEALEKIKELSPDVVLSDITMPRMNGLELIRQVEKEKINAKIIILSIHEDEDYIVDVISNGAYGYLLKNCNKNELLSAIEGVAIGKKYYSSNVSIALANHYKEISERASNLKETKISEREYEVLKLIIQGLSNKEIADKLYVSTRTIDSHRYNIMKKLNAKNLAELIQRAAKLGLTSSGKTLH